MHAFIEDFRWEFADNLKKKNYFSLHIQII